MTKRELFAMYISEKNYWDAAKLFPYKNWCDKLGFSTEDNYADAYIAIVEKCMASQSTDYYAMHAMCNMMVKKRFSNYSDLPIGISVNLIQSDIRNNSETELFYDEIIDFIFRKAYYWGQGDIKEEFSKMITEAPSNKLTRYIIDNDVPLSVRMFTVVMRASGYSYSSIALMLGVAVDTVRLYEIKSFRRIYHIIPAEVKKVIKLL